EINALAARLGDPPRGVDPAAVGIQQQRRHHDGIIRWLAPLAAVGAGDLSEVDIVPDQAQHKAGEMVLGHEVPHRRWQKQWLINLPGAECLAHAQRQNLTRSSLASKNHLLLGQAPSRDTDSIPQDLTPPLRSFGRRRSFFRYKARPTGCTGNAASSALGPSLLVKRLLD